MRRFCRQFPCPWWVNFSKAYAARCLQEFLPGSLGETTRSGRIGTPGWQAGRRAIFFAVRKLDAQIITGQKMLYQTLRLFNLFESCNFVWFETKRSEISLDWLKGKPTGNHVFFLFWFFTTPYGGVRGVRGFKFPRKSIINQSIEDVEVVEVDGSG